MTIGAWLALVLLGQGGEPPVRIGIDRPGAHGVTMPAQPDLPVDRDFLLTIADERLLADGQSATFVQSMRVRFSPDPVDGWRALLDQARHTCSGPEAVCAAFLQMLSPRAANVRQFRISQQGVVWPDHDPLPLALPDRGLPGANSALIVADTESRNPGQLESGELREALQFIGLGIASSGPALNPDMGEIQSVGRDAGGHILLHLRREIATGAMTGRLVQDQHSVVDARSGLLLDSRIVTRLAGDDGTLVSISQRHWQLAPIATP